MTDLRRLLAWSFVLCVVLGGTFGARRAESSPTQDAPRLVLMLSIDQMRFDYLTRFDSVYEAGLRRLLDRGAVFTNARFGHATTETGPGHAVLLSGRHACHSGIVGNSWYDDALGRRVNVVEDPVHSALGGKGRGASPANFIGFMLGDKLKLASPGSRVVGVALKDRAAVLMAGKRADAAYWYDWQGSFTTSTYYFDRTPAWLLAWNTRRRVESFSGREWTRLLEPEVYESLVGADAVAGEADPEHNTFPHLIRTNPEHLYDDFRFTPFADEVTLEVALEAMSAHELGADEATDLLTIGFSTTDLIGHRYGPDSHEILDQLVRLDRVLGRLFDEIDRRVGLSRTLVVLAGDHGAMPLVEVLNERGVEARRVRPNELTEPVEQALAQRFAGKHDLIEHVYNGVYLNLDALRSQGVKRADVEETVRQALLETGLVAAVYTQAELLGEPPANDPFFALHRESFFEPRSAHLLFRLQKYLYEDEFASGTGHGTPYDYDRHVPIVFMGPGVSPGQYEQDCGPVDIAPTLGRMLGIDYPMQDAKRILSEVWR
jgi:predicted AlkP superfamily pyrophosphatase or phosphodiesterase